MVSKRNTPLNVFTPVLASVLLVVFSMTAQAQLFQKKSKEKEQPGSGYAYQTYSTLQKKEKRKGYSGHESRFHFEKPLEPLRYGEIDRIVDYSKTPYFGHKRPPVRRPVGSTRLCRVCGIKH
jgi:hypothetical protein